MTKFLNFIFISVVFITTNCNAGGLSTWTQRTPGNNEILFESHYPTKTTILYCIETRNELDYRKEVIKDLNRWFFYKNFIIGESDNAETTFFVFNEQDCNSIFFKNNKEFETYLVNNNLEPKIWTRWYDNYWGWIYTECEGFHCGFNFFLFALLLIVFIIVFIIILIRNRFSLSNRTNKIMLAIAILISIRIILDLYPHSI